MAVRELHKYEFSCDGYIRGNGVKCSRTDIVEAYNPINAEQRAPTGNVKLAGDEDYREWHWTHSSQGWLCPYYVHRDDLRAR